MSVASGNGNKKAFKDMCPKYGEGPLLFHHDCPLVDTSSIKTWSVGCGVEDVEWRSISGGHRPQLY